MITENKRIYFTLIWIVSWLELFSLRIQNYLKYKTYH